MKQIIFICVFLLCSMSCYEDLGNYDYDSLPNITIDSVSADYGIKRVFIDSLIIKPIISFGEENESSFDMNWYEFKNDKLELITNSSELNLFLSSGGARRFLFEVVHKETGLSKRKTTRIFVASEMQRGFYILKETADGNTELDGFVRLEKGEYNLYPNLITMKLGKPLEGKPIALDYWDWLYNDYANDEIVTKRVIRPASEKDIAIFDMLDFAHLGGIPELFYDLEGDVKIQGIKSIKNTSVFFYNNGRFRVMPNDKASRFQSEIYGDYELEPVIASADEGYVFIYDKKSSSFKYIDGTITSPKKCKDYSYLGEYLPMNNWDANLRFLGRSTGNPPPFHVNKGIGYALMEKKHSTDSLFMLHFTLGMARNNTMVYSDAFQIDTLSPKLNLRRAELFAMHSHQKILFYSIGNRVFSYNVWNQTEDLAIGENDFPGGAPDEITFMKHVIVAYDGDNFFIKLFVGGYKNGQYTLYGYDMVGGKPKEEPWVFSGEGKIKKILYASPNDITPFYIWQ